MGGGGGGGVGGGVLHDLRKKGEGKALEEKGGKRDVLFEWVIRKREPEFCLQEKKN